MLSNFKGFIEHCLQIGTPSLIHLIIYIIFFSIFKQCIKTYSLMNNLIKIIFLIPFYRYVAHISLQREHRWSDLNQIGLMKCILRKRSHKMFEQLSNLELIKYYSCSFFWSKNGIYCLNQTDNV